MKSDLTCCLKQRVNKVLNSSSIPEGERPSLSRQSSTGQSSMSNQASDISTVNIPAVKMEEKERPSYALQILKLVCESTVLKPHLRDLLSAK